ncbi:hypothetical protein Q8A67_022613 [Cirrhinus molitorella]|uniref:Uncharacterized protein n=1 Tax=Cirrhinus molitorella TaxID=172907 RepID=A0AA88TB82_9TELE|nr:hypothetical protein Q8A67_022613 [Cirrhinus molitorella]
MGEGPNTDDPLDNTLSTLFEQILRDRSHVHPGLSLSLSRCGRAVPRALAATRSVSPVIQLCEARLEGPAFSSGQRPLLPPPLPRQP